MSDMRDLLSKLDKLNERQQWDSLDAIVDRYARPGMTLQDLVAMEQAARDVREVGDGSFWGNLRAAGRSMVSNESFRINYVLYHAGEKLGIEGGLFGSDGMLRTMGSDSMYNAERVRPTDAAARNIAVQQARLNILPERVSTAFGIRAGGEGETMRPTREGFITATNPNSIQFHSTVNFRGQSPYVDIQRSGQLTRVYARDAELLRSTFPNATVMKADGSGPYFEEPAQAAEPAAPAAAQTAEPASATDAAASAIDRAAPQDTEYQRSLDAFTQSDQRGLANNPEATGAIQELNRRLNELGFTGIQSDSQEYGSDTRSAVRAFQQAYNGMYPSGSPDRIAVDGDLGPNTLRALQQVEEDFQTLERLLRSSVTDSIQYKSAISLMLESLIKEELNSTQLADMTRSLIALDKFIGALPEGSFNIESKKDLLIRARTAVNDHVSGMSQEPTPNIVELSNGSITPVSRATEPTATEPSAAARVADPEGDGNADDPEAQTFVAQPSDAGEPRAAEQPASDNRADTPDARARQAARIVYNAVDGVGTDLEEIRLGLELLQSKNEFDRANEYADEFYGETLIDLINGDVQIARDRVEYLYPQLRRLEVPHTVQMQRLRDIAGVNFRRDIEPYYDAQGRFPPQRDDAGSVRADAQPNPTSVPSAEVPAGTSGGRLPQSALDAIRQGAGN